MNKYCNGYGYFDNNNSSWNNSNNYDYKDIFNDIKFVYCPLCRGKAYIKTNRRNNKMLRCDLCNALMFANGTVSRQHLLNLPEYQEYY